MHISEGVIAAPVLAAGAVLAAGGLYLGLRRMDAADLPRTALLAAVFFVASLIHVPIGPVSAHLVMAGLVGLMLGWGAFPAIFAALALQAVLFQYGGLIVLGVNTVNMAAGALAAYYLFGAMAASGRRTLVLCAGFGAGLVSVLVSSLLTAASLALSGEDFTGAAQALVLAHVPVMAAEAVVTAMAAGFLNRVRPGMIRQAMGGRGAGLAGASGEGL